MSLKSQSYLFMLAGWLISMGIGYSLFSTIWGAILFLPVIMLCMVVAISVFVTVTKIVPSYFMRWLRGPPWKHPRTLSQIGNRRDQLDIRALEARLDEVDKCDKKRATLYVDRHTGQHWMKQDTDKYSDYVPVSDIIDWS